MAQCGCAFVLRAALTLPVVDPSGGYLSITKGKRGYTFGTVRSEVHTYGYFSLPSSEGPSNAKMHFKILFRALRCDPRSISPLPLC